MTMQVTRSATRCSRSARIWRVVAPHVVTVSTVLRRPDPARRMHTLASLFAISIPAHREWITSIAGLLSCGSCESVRRGEGRKSRKSDARARSTNPRFPWKPSATMLTYRLTGTKVGPGSTTTNRPIIAPCSTQPQQATTAESSPTTVRHGTRRRTADLIDKLAHHQAINGWFDTRGGQQVKVESRADDRRRAQRALSRPIETVDARGDGRLKGGGHANLSDLCRRHVCARLPAQHSTLGQVAHDLFGEERITGGPLGDRLAQPADGWVLPEQL